MKNRILRLAPALLAGLVVAGMSEAQPPGKKGGPPRGEGRGGPGDGFRGFGGPGGAFALERAVDDLKLSDKAKEKAEAALKEYRENVRKLTDLARSDLLLKMGEVLGPEELKTFKTALDRPPGPPPGGRGFAAARRGLTSDQIVERILSFDKNKDGKVTKDELPERMQDLIAKGDTNKDRALDKDEIKALAAKLEQEGLPPGFDGRGGPGGRGGRGPDGRGGRGGPGGGFPPGGGFGPGGGAERALDELKLADQTREKAEALVKAYRDDVRKLMDLPRAGLLLKMRDALSEDEFKKFKKAVDRPPGPPPAGDRGAPDLDRKLQEIQKQLDDLRREIRR